MTNHNGREKITVAGVAAFFNEAAVGSSFQRATDGHAVVRPWPWRSSAGYQVPDAATERGLRNMMKRWLWTAPPVFVMFGVLGGSALLRLAPVYILTYYGCLLSRVNRYSRARARANERAVGRSPRG
jgi:hypothetical protein